MGTIAAHGVGDDAILGQPRPQQVLHDGGLVFQIMRVIPGLRGRGDDPLGTIEGLGAGPPLATGDEGRALGGSCRRRHRQVHDISNGAPSRGHCS